MKKKPDSFRKVKRDYKNLQKAYKELDAKSTNLFNNSLDINEKYRNFVNELRKRGVSVKVWPMHDYDNMLEELRKFFDFVAEAATKAQKAADDAWFKDVVEH